MAVISINWTLMEPAPVAQAFALGEVVSNTSAAEDNTNVKS